MALGSLTKSLRDDLELAEGAYQRVAEEGLGQKPRGLTKECKAGGETMRNGKTKRTFVF